MLTPGTAANPSWAHEPNGQTGFGKSIVREFKRPVALALLFLAGRINGLTMSPLRSVNCSIMPSMCA